uniref:Uncharacterized protein n=1 Tax=Arundo donax TaxID=35708 RepID=A0A0A9C709_ARUDO
MAPKNSLRARLLHPPTTQPLPSPIQFTGSCKAMGKEQAGAAAQEKKHMAA